MANTRSRKKKGNTPKKNKIKLFPPSRLAEIMFYSFVMFVLGVLAGRGTAPIGFEIDNSHEDRKHFEVPAQFEPVQVKIDFYNELSSDKDFEINKSIIKTEEKLPVKIPLYKGEKKQSELFFEPLPNSDAKFDNEQKTISRPKDEEKKQNNNKDIFTVQIAAMKNKDDADYLAKKISNQGFPAYSASGLSEDSVLWYRVRVGRFEDKNQAENMKKKLLEKLKISGIVLTIK